MGEDGKKVWRVSLQGNIGAGKSSLITYLRERGQVTQREPIEEWEQLLERAEGERGEDYELHLQAKICISISNREDDRWLKEGNEAIFQERNLDSAINVFIPAAIDGRKLGKEGEKTLRVLSQTLHNLKKIEKEKWEKENNCEIEDKIIYIRTTPEECLRRITERKQAGDKYLSIDYISQLHKLHENWLMTGEERKDIVVLDGNLPLGEDKKLDELLQKWKLY